jgi:hypothetical protein
MVRLGIEPRTPRFSDGRETPWLSADFAPGDPRHGKGVFATLERQLELGRDLAVCPYYYVVGFGSRVPTRAQLITAAQRLYRRVRG